MPFLAQWLCKYICHHILRADVLQCNSAYSHLVTDEMILDIDMLGAVMVLWILGVGRTESKWTRIRSGGLAGWSSYARPPF